MLYRIRASRDIHETWNRTRQHLTVNATLNENIVNWKRSKYRLAKKTIYPQRKHLNDRFSCSLKISHGERTAFTNIVRARATLHNSIEFFSFVSDTWYSDPLQLTAIN